MNLEFLNQIMDKAAEVSLSYFQTKDLNIESKLDDSPVTIADKETELAIRKLITDNYPHSGILGEEFPTLNPDAEYLWVIDPIDGTRAFVKNIDTFSNMVALLKDGVPIMSAVNFPAKGERFIGINRKAYLNGAEITASTAALNDCSTCFCGEFMFDQDELSRVKKVIAKTKGIIVGGDAYNYCRMACGDSRVIVESDLQPYDFLPLLPILNGAGASISDWDGNTLTVNSSIQVVAGSKSAYQSALDLLN